MPFRSHPFRFRVLDPLRVSAFGETGRNTGGGTICCMIAKHALAASLTFVAVAASAAGQDEVLQKRTIQLNSDLTSQVLVMGRDNTGRKLSASPAALQLRSPARDSTRPVGRR
jgi:hypothetical protein